MKSRWTRSTSRIPSNRKVVSLLTKAHIKTINDCRRLLRSLQLDAQEDEFSDGKFNEACKSANDALGNVLAVARSWLEMEISDADLAGH